MRLKPMQIHALFISFGIFYSKRIKPSCIVDDIFKNKTVCFKDLFKIIHITSTVFYHMTSRLGVK